MKKITRSFALKTIAFILCIVCFGASAHVIFRNILTRGAYQLEETAEQALSYKIWSSVNMIREELVAYNSAIKENAASIREVFIPEDIKENPDAVVPEADFVLDEHGDFVPNENGQNPEQLDIPAYTQRKLSFINSQLDKDKFEYYISIGGEHISNSSGNTADYTSASLYYVFENGYEECNSTNFSRPFFEDSNNDLSDCRILIKLNPDYAMEFRGIWLTEKAVLEKSVPTALMLLALSVVCIIYLLWVCGRNGGDDEVHLLLIDRMYVEINLSLITAAVVGAGLCVIWIIDYIISCDIVLENAYLHALTAVISAAAAIITALMMSLMRNLKNRSFLRYSLILCLIQLCIKLIKVIWKYTKILTVKIFKLIKFIFNHGIKITRLLFGWIFSISGKIFRAAKNICCSAKEILMRAVGGKGKKIGRIAAAELCVYSIVLIFLTCCAVDREEFTFLMLIFIVFAVYHLLHRLADADRIKEGIFEIKSGNTDFKIENVSGMFADTADAVNTIGDGIKLSVERGVKAERMKSELITNVSHDLKTPLTSIINYSELLCGEKLNPAEANDYVRIIREKAERLKKLTSDLFDISRAQSGNEVINIERIDIGLLINQTLAEQEENIKNSGLDFEVDISDGVYADADGKKMSRVFENLIINAVKYSMKGTRVYITAENKGASTVEIKNIASYKMNFSEDEITERFVRGDVSRSTDGSGLGLAIAKSYTEICGGSFNITVDGDLFKVRITF